MSTTTRLSGRQRITNNIYKGVGCFVYIYQCQRNIIKVHVTKLKGWYVLIFPIRALLMSTLALYMYMYVRGQGCAHAHIVKEVSLNNEGNSCYVRLVQGRHDGLIFTEV